MHLMTFNTPPPLALRKRSGFTLVEIIVVITVISLMLALAGMGVAQSLTAQRLSGAAQALKASLNHASLLAQKENRPVQVRFYKFASVENPASPQFRATQMAVLTGVDDSGTPIYRFITEVGQLPSGIILSANPDHNTIAALPEQSPHLTDPQFQGAAYTYCSYEVRPDGSTTLPRTGPGVITLVVEDQSPNGTTLPDNYRSVTLDPFNARARMY